MSITPASVAKRFSVLPLIAERTLSAAEGSRQRQVSEVTGVLQDVFSKIAFAEMTGTEAFPDQGILLTIPTRESPDDRLYRKLLVEGLDDAGVEARATGPNEYRLFRAEPSLRLPFPARRTAAAWVEQQTPHAASAAEEHVKNVLVAVAAANLAGAELSTVTIPWSGAKQSPLQAVISSRVVALLAKHGLEQIPVEGNKVEVRRSGKPRQALPAYVQVLA